MLMTYRVFSLSVMALALFAVSVSALAAEDAKEVKATKEAPTHVGKLVRITGDKLVMTNKEGKEHSHTLTADAKITCDGTVCKAKDLKAGTKIRVTTLAGDAKVATRIEAIDKNESFANTHEGKVVSITGNKLVMTNTQGKETHTCTLTADVKVTCDGEVCKTSDLKPGMRIRVTSESDAPHSANRIEALDKNTDFAAVSNRKHDGASLAVDPANTGVNVRDRDNSAKTPFDQNENRKDIDITANIRKRVVDSEMSVNAQNVKIITQDGKVTLRGPVKSADEKKQIEKLAQEVAGAANVDNQLEVQP